MQRDLRTAIDHTRRSALECAARNGQAIPPATVGRANAAVAAKAQRTCFDSNDAGADAASERTLLARRMAPTLLAPGSLSTTSPLHAESGASLASRHQRQCHFFRHAIQPPVQHRLLQTQA